MTAGPYSREFPVQGTVGHQNDDSNRYSDTSEPVPDDPTQRRACVRCGLAPTASGADPCIAGLPGVDYACCGHGGAGYVSFTDGRAFRFVNQDGEAIRREVAAHANGKGELPPGWTWDRRARGER
jgi:hypothetical protein